MYQMLEDNEYLDSYAFDEGEVYETNLWCELDSVLEAYE